MLWRDVKPQNRAGKSLNFLGVCAAFWLSLIVPASSADMSDLPEQLQQKVETAR
ncbi:hypothetical protein SAMN04488036_1086 [Shimia haliotis]|uniref:Uncharacterized protein n=1 Tax=Shimia haliotis TaxID=1280847 RepID=A0A1I4GBU3_9RHOB|nr:hypothetical protein SAMN04488036_1086 [Shimia haliotis]